MNTTAMSLADLEAQLLGLQTEPVVSQQAATSQPVVNVVDAAQPVTKDQTAMIAEILGLPAASATTTKPVESVLLKAQASQVATVQPQVVDAPVQQSQPQAQVFTQLPPGEDDSIIKSDGPITAPLKEFVSPAQLRRDVSFDLTDLDGAIRDHASGYVHYAALAARARRQYDLNKALTEVAESKLYAIHREALAAEGKKATEAQVDAAVKGDPRWLAAQQRLIDARAIYDLAGDAREAFMQRKDMLVQVSVDRRTEMQGELRIRAAQAVGDARSEAVRAASGIARSAA